MEERPGNRIIAINVISSAIQVIIVGLAYFLIYRILISTLGVEVLGIWSLIIALSSISGLSNFGFQSAIVKYIAEYNARGELAELSRLLFTSILSIIVIFMFIALLIYLSAHLFIGRLIDPHYVRTAMVVLPISLLGLFISSFSGALTSALEGFQRNYIRNFTYSFTSVLYLILAIIFIPHFGLIGLAVAQVIQALVSVVISYYFLNKTCFNFNFFRWNWDRKLFKILLNYGYKMQIVSIFQMLADPLTKILLSRFSGNITLGYYEMASKFITQLRQIIAGMCQVTIPIVSHFVQIKISEIRNVYNTSFSFLVFVAFPLFTAIILFTPHLSRIWIGNVEPIFVNCAYILDLGMLINILCAPAYFNSLGEGKLNGVLYMSGIVLFLIAILGFILGKTVQDYGVVISYALSTGSGSIFLIRYYHKLKNISFKDLLKFSDYSIIICSLLFAGITIFLFTNFGSRINFNIKSLICFILIYLAIFVPIASLNANFKLLDIRQYFKS